MPKLLTIWYEIKENEVMERLPRFYFLSNRL